MDNLIAVKNRKEIHHHNDAFAEFMEMAENEFNSRALSSPGLYCKCTSHELEEVAVSLLKDIAPQTPFSKDDIKLVSGFRFPDIVAGKNYGIEVKSTCKNHWTSTGSSIVESTRDDNIENIYMLFGKLGGTPAEFRCRPYGECLSGIAVTHSPRYLINMDIAPSETIFRKMNTTYDEFRKSDTAIETVREYYYKKAKLEGKEEMPWWFSSADTSSSVNVRLWSSCSREEKVILKAKMIVLFPEILERQYANMALWLCSYHSIIIHNARDIMSASGQYRRFRDGGVLVTPVPHVVGAILEVAPVIKSLFRDISFIENELRFYRSELFYKNASLYSSWISEVSKQINDIIARSTNGKVKEIPFASWFNDEIVLVR